MASQDQAGLRKRKGQLKAEPTPKATSAPKASSSSFTSLILSLLVAVAGGIVLLQFPDLPRRAFEAWIGTSQSGDADLRSFAAPKSHVVDFSADVPKRDAVVEAFKHAWLAYERDALGADEYHPISHTGTNLTAAGGIGYTVIDSIDTMLLMNLTDEYARARTWVEQHMDFDRDASFNTFETTIRVLGGLLTAYDLTGHDQLYLDKAVDLAERMLPVFNTPSGLPTSMVNLAKREGVPDKDNYGFVSTAEAATLQLEFRYLAQVTGNEVYWQKAERVMKVIKESMPPAGLASIFMDPESGQFVQSAIRLGSRGDSFYEYLLKQWLQTNKTEDVYREMYEDAMGAIHQHLVKKSMFSNLIYTSELIPERFPSGQVQWRLVPKQDHLVCFLGGSLMLGAVTAHAKVDKVSIPPTTDELTQTGLRDWKTGAELTRTCMKTHDTATGLAPEIVHFRIPSDNMDEIGIGKTPSDWYIKGAPPGEPAPLDARYILRPETVESLFLAFRVTGNPSYREQGWRIFQAIEKHCKIPSGGYAAVINVDHVPVEHENKMETFLMSETLKYLYLLFADDSILPLSDYVFNTEAHPLPVFTPDFPTGFS